MSWVDGFMSGWNLASLAKREPVRDFEKESYEQHEQYIRSYCDNYPLQVIGSAAVQLYHSLPATAAR